MTRAASAKPAAPVRKPRADAERNRKRLLQVAKSVFRKRGAEATLEEIARIAGVGIGTLYRHFPTRTDLVHAVYIDELEALEAAGLRFTAEQAPAEALRLWLHVFVEYMVAKRIVRELLDSGSANTKWPVDAGARIQASITALTDRAVEAGEIELRMEPFDLLRALIGVATAAPGEGWEDSARQLVDVLIAGLRTRTRA